MRCKEVFPPFEEDAELTYEYYLRNAYRLLYERWWL